MIDIFRLFQAFLAPALFVSATSLLILSINVRLMGIVSRLRQFVHAKHDAARNDRMQEAEAYTAQIASIERRAEIIRRSFLLALISLAATITSCLLLGVGSLPAGRGSGGSGRFCHRDDLPAAGDLLLHSRSDGRPQLRARRSARPGLYGSGDTSRSVSSRCFIARQTDRS